ncbi:type VI secretion system membrane subunit TssM [Amaricoccus sp.]|uniref:type VI secretion system membrane subunit TssM n=1 Tax=Amaricoccus sp. TaxID=1872485 RepID=UPI001B69185E|nr:type VI secretion system membrane subunit TssM [Amaricoccus sp.]MBP7000314.1 type VI secretion system membrane subunit TssM [Amaricoccus sp.]
MAILRFLWSIVSSRWLWTAIGLVLLSALIWLWGPALAFGEAAPLASEGVRLGLIGALLVSWLLWLILSRRRAMRANRLFVAELAQAPEKPNAPGEENVAAVGAKFREVLAELRRRKLGGRRFLREMPWYVIIGPPATGKTTALRQSGLSFPIDLTDDLQGVGGTRNCDWFFTEDAVLIDTAGRYVLQESQPEVDAAEWMGFLDLLKRHRGRRALNGVIVALSVETLSDGDAAIRAHGGEIRKRLNELQLKLEMRLPVYLMLTKADLVAGFEPFFGELTTAQREQVWGATFAPGARVDGAEAARELVGLAAELERRIVPRLEAEERASVRAETFRFPAQVASLAEPLRILVDKVFGESRYEESAWLRGVYLTSATQEGAPIDRLTAALASSFGLPAGPPPPRQRTERRSFFLKDLMTEVVFKEAGLGVLDPAAEERRTWIWRGAAVACAAAALAAGLVFTLAYLSGRGAAAAQAAALERLQATLAPVAARQAPVDPLDLDVALEAMTTIENAAVPAPGGLAGAVGPSPAAEMAAAQATAYERGLRNILEPRMVALLEATMWRHVRDPDFLLDALKTYRMMTGLAQMDPAFAAEWWTTRLPEFAPLNPFPTAAAADHQVAALRRMAVEESYIAPDEALVGQALASICSIPLSVRAYNALRSDPAAVALEDWIPAAHAGPNGPRVFTRISGKTLRVGIDGVYTYAGFHDVVLARIDDVAAQAALDRSVFAGGCPESSDPSVTALADDIMKLYYEDFIARWDGLLRDIRLAPFTDLTVAGDNLKDLSSADSALRRLVTAVAAETDLARPADAGAAGGPPPKAASKILAKLGKLGKLAKQGAKLVPAAGAASQGAVSGQLVSDHFKPIRAAVQETDGQPPLLTDVEAALTALSNVLQTVAASPNPEEAIKQQGGLAELTGQVANQAAILPDPLDDWLAGIAGDTIGLTEAAVVSRLNAIWKADGKPLCDAALATRYPFVRGSMIDVTLLDFQRMFGPGGVFDAFTNDELAPYIDTASRPWRWRSDLRRDPATLVPFEKARRLRNALFAGGSGPVMAFTVQPTLLSPNAARMTLNIGGTALIFYGNPLLAVPVTWPGEAGAVFTATFYPADGSPEVMMNQSGDWALLRVLQANRLSPTAQPEVFTLRLGKGGYWADLELRAASVENALDLSIFEGFACPSQI